MSNVSLFENLGFDSNPFQYSNADREDRLAEYFIAPPYFDSVYGEPARPSSCIVFAPRGGGKSAQRRMIEIRGQETPILCLTYDRFEFTPSMRLEDVSLQYHLRQIIRIALIGILTQMQLKQEKPASFTNAEKKLLRSFVVTYFTDATTSDIRDAIESLRSFSEKIKSMWNEYLEIMTPLVNLIFRRYAIDPVSFARFKREESRLDPSLKYQLRMIYELASKLGLKAIYILIDKVDETEYTGNDPDASFQLISPLIRDLELLDMKGYAFKFFLWVELKTVPSARVSSIEEDMACLDLFSLQETVRLWEHYSGKQGKYLTKKSASLLRSTHRGVCILAGTTDLETQVPRDRPIWGPPKRHEIGEQFALWVWDRPLEKRA